MNPSTDTATGSAQGGRVVLPIVGQDPGPMARLAEVQRDPQALGVIAQRVAGGETLRQIARAWEVPHGQLLLWLMDDDNRWQLYRNALVASGFTESDEAKEIADGVPVQAVDPEGKPLVDEAGKPVLVEHDAARDKLRTEVRRWRAGKNAPGYFGERLDVAMARSLPTEGELLAQLNALVSAQPWLLEELVKLRGAAGLPVGVTYTQPPEGAGSGAADESNTTHAPIGAANQETGASA